MSTRAVAGEAAALLRRLLVAIEAGEFDADGPVGSGIVRQMQGAALALEALRPLQASSSEGLGAVPQPEKSS